MERSEHHEPVFSQQDCSQGRIKRWLGRLARLAKTDPDDGDGVSEIPSSASPQPSGEPDWDRRLKDHLRMRLEQLEEARAPVKGAAVHYGASNFPHDPEIWVADWRDNLPPDDPRRNEGPPIVRHGSVAAYERMKAAHDAICNAYGLSPESEDDPH